MANLLGYKSYSAYALELCMAKNPENVKMFLENLSVKLKSLLQNELDILLKYKKEEVRVTIVHRSERKCFFFFCYSVKDLKNRLMGK